MPYSQKYTPPHFCNFPGWLLYFFFVIDFIGLGRARCLQYSGLPHHARQYSLDAEIRRSGLPLSRCNSAGAYPRDFVVSGQHVAALQFDPVQ